MTMRELENQYKDVRNEMLEIIQSPNDLRPEFFSSSKITPELMNRMRELSGDYE